MKKSILKISTLVIGIFVLAALIFSCTNRNWEKLHPYGQTSGPAVPCSDTTGVTISYSVTIQPIINAKCATPACHVSGGSGVDYTIFSNVFNDACYPCGNLFMDRLTRPQVDPLHMPQNQPSLDPCDIKKINRWVFEGCPQN